ncbi:MAG: ABC transporter ATP-binding protein [Actinomycetota bacterium]|nr:ABC transporter ATP-binding protein [Actinomycetota bacterium]
MHPDVVAEIEDVWKKYCKTLRRSMMYGLSDIARNALGLSSHSEKLRKKEFWALEGISAEVKKGEVLGIIGPNGAGKTTLLKLLNGIFWPDKGRIKVRGRTGALIEVGAGFNPLLTGRENIYINAAILGMTKNEVKERFQSIVEFADIGDFIDAPVKHYSSGMFVRLGFAVAVHCEPTIMLVDEVLAVGDEGFQAKCFDRLGELRKNGLATVLVSHNMHTISTNAERLILLNDGEARYFENVAEGIKEYMKQFVGINDSGLERICNSGRHIEFHGVEVNKRSFEPGESFEIQMKYEAAADYSDVEIDVGIYSSNEKGFYFQATNRAYKQPIDLHKGEGELKIHIEDIRLANALAKVAISIWSKGREELLFWWRIPVEFRDVEFSTGKNFLHVRYENI